MMWSVRPLRIEEFGAPVATSFSEFGKTHLRSMLSIDMGRDLRDHLGCFVVVKVQYARLSSAFMRKPQKRDDTVRLFGLESDSNLTRRCLHYIFLRSWRH